MSPAPTRGAAGHDLDRRRRTRPCSSRRRDPREATRGTCLRRSGGIVGVLAVQRARSSRFVRLTSRRCMAPRPRPGELTINESPVRIWLLRRLHLCFGLTTVGVLRVRNGSNKRRVPLGHPPSGRPRARRAGHNSRCWQAGCSTAAAIRTGEALGAVGSPAGAGVVLGTLLR
jgi:hypothetical protein